MENQWGFADSFVNEFNGVDDMISLTNLTEESLVENLRVRYQRGIIYVKSFNLLKT